MSVLIPCLNEEAGIAQVVQDALEGLETAGLAGEVIVIDNASEDRSAELARAAGAAVVHEPRRGYGSAYLAGLAAARGRYVVMADGDGTYPVRELGAFVERLRAGADLVLGSRFKGQIRPGAMPWTNRFIGNPILTGMLRLMFGRVVSDAHCGLRAVRRDAVPELKLSATGMEFASEMVIKAAKRNLAIEEIPITYSPRIGESKLNRFRDAWRHVRFMLVHSPTFLFAIPGGVALAGGLGVLCALAAVPSAGAGSWGLPLAIGAALLTIIGAQVVQLGLYSRTYGVLYLGEEDATLERLWKRLRLEHGLAAGCVVLGTGAVLTIVAWIGADDQPRLGLLGLTLVALGVQGVFSAFFLSILGLSDHAIIRRRR